MPKAKEEKKFGPYEWAENPLKLNLAKKYVADLEANNQIQFADETEREQRVRERYVELNGHIKGDKVIRPRVSRPLFGGQPTGPDDDDEDDE